MAEGVVLGVTVFVAELVDVAVGVNVFVKVGVAVLFGVKVGVGPYFVTIYASAPAMPAL